MINIDLIKDVNLRHLARMKNALEQYSSHSISLQSLIGDLSFISNSIDCLVEDDFIPLNDCLIDLESVNSAQLDGKSFPEMESVVSKAINGCQIWIERIESKIASA